MILAMADYSLITFCAAPSGFSWWTIVPTLIGGALSAGAGVLSGLYLASKNRKEADRREQEKRDRERRSATMRGSMKVQLMANGTETIHRSIEECIKVADAKGIAAAPLHIKVFPLAGHHVSPVRFEIDELAAFLDAKEDEFTNALLLAAERYMTLQVACAEYSARRIAFTDLWTTYLANSTASGGKLTNEQDESLKLRGKELEDQISNLRSMAIENVGDLFKLADAFGPKAREHLKDPGFPLLTLKEPAAKAAEARAAKA
jgi:hypothetical protein